MHFIICYTNRHYGNLTLNKYSVPRLTAKCFVLYVSCLLSLLLISITGQSQNPALPPVACQHSIGEFDHFESRTDGLRLFSKLPDGWEIYSKYDSTATLVSIDTIGRDTISTLAIVLDSILVERNYLGEVIGQRILPHHLWMSQNPAVPSSRLTNAVLLDSCYYFLWVQLPYSASWPGRLRIIKTDYNFDEIAQTPDLDYFFDFQGVEYFGLVSNDLIGVSYHLAGGQSTTTTNMKIFDKNLVAVIQQTNWGGVGSSPPGSGLKRLTNNCFSYNKIYGEDGGKIVHYQVYQRSNGQNRLLHSKWLKISQLSNDPPLFRIQTAFIVWDETGIPVVSVSDKLLPVYPTYVNPDPAAMSYYAIDTLHIVAPLTVNDSLSALFTMYSFYPLHGVVNIGKHLWAIVNLHGNQLVDISCANPQDSVISNTTNSKLPDKVNIFPNPTQGHFYIEPISENEKIDLFSADGRLLTSQIKLLQESTRYVIDLTLLPKGIYFWRIQERTKGTSQWGQIVFE